MVDIGRFYGVTRNNHFDYNIRDTKMDLEKKVYIEKLWNTSLMKSINKFYNMFSYDRMIFFLRSR